MIFVDTNVFMYAVGRAHPLREPSRAFFEASLEGGRRLCTSAEVLQEMLHAYLPVGRLAVFERALSLVDRLNVDVWALEQADVRAAQTLLGQFPSLGARDLCHLGSCRRRGVRTIRTYDRALAAAFGSD